MARDNGAIDGTAVSRRAWLRGTAAGAASLLAGCGGDGSTDAPAGDDPTAEPRIDEEGFVRQYLDYANQAPVGTASLNRYSPGYDSQLADVSVPKLANYSATYLGWVPQVTKEKEVGPAPGTLDRENDEYRVEIMEGMLWDGGEEVLAEDWLIQAELDRRILPKDVRPEPAVLTGYRVGDNDHEMVFELDGEAGYNKPSVINEVFFGAGYGLSYNMKRGSFFQDKLEALRSATTTDERSAIRRQITRKQLTLSMDTVTTAGPYRVGDATRTVGTYHTQPDHAVAEHNGINWQGVKVSFNRTSNPGQRVASFGENALDLWHGIAPPDVNAPGNFTQMINRETGGMAFQFNFGVAPDGGEALNDPLPAPFGDHRVRQAIAHVVPPKEVARAAKPVAQGPYLGKPSPLMPAQVREAYPELYPDLNAYGTDEETAARLMREAGLSRNSDGTWVRGDGRPLSVSVMPSSASSEWLGAAGGMVQVLQRFGIEASLSVTGQQQLGISLGNGTYETAIGGWGYGRPALYFAMQFFDPTTAAGEELQIKHAFRAPKRVGQPDAPLTTWETADLIDGIRTVPIETARDRVRTLVWVHNFALPTIPITRDGSGLEINTETFAWPPSPPSHPEVGLYHVVPSRPRDGWDEYPATYGAEREANEALIRGHLDGEWRGTMQANPGPFDS